MGPLRGDSRIRAGRGDRHDPAPGRMSDAADRLGAGVEDHASLSGGIVEAADRDRVGAGLGIAGRGHDHRHRRLRRPVDAHIVERPGSAGDHDLVEVAAQQPDHRLRLGIPETAVELEHLQPVVGDHEPGVKQPAVGRAREAQRGQGRPDDLLAGSGDQIIVGVGRRRHRSHAAGVGAAVAVTEPLVVLGGRQHREPLAVAERHHRHLSARKPLLQQDLLASRSEPSGHQHRLHRGGGRLLGVGDDHALARGQARRLHHRHVRPGPQMRQSRASVAEHRGGRGRDPVVDEEALAVGLGRLEAGARPAGAEGGDPGSLQRVHQALGQRRLRAHRH